MYCSKCGNEIKETDTFCSKCGTQTKADMCREYSGGKQIALQLPGVKNLHRNAVALILSVLMLLICVFLVGTKMFQVNYTVWFATETVEMTMFENAGVLLALFIIGYLASIIIMLLPLKTGKSWEMKDFIPAAIMPVLGILAFLVSLSVVQNKLNDGGLIGEIAEFEMNIRAGAWVFLTASAISEILTIKTSQDIIGAQTYWSQRETTLVRGKASIEVMSENGAVDGWICTCGRKNAKYVSTCVCGKNKSDM